MISACECNQCKKQSVTHRLHVCSHGVYMQTHLGLANPTLPISPSGHGLSRYTMAAGLNASKMHGTHSQIPGEWKRNKRKHSPFSPGGPVRLCLITTVTAVAKSWFISYWSLFFFSFLWNILSSFDSFGGFSSVLQYCVSECGELLSGSAICGGAEGLRASSERRF